MIEAKIVFKNIPERKEVEISVETNTSTDAAQQEIELCRRLMPGVLYALGVACNVAIIGTGDKTLEEMRQAARIHTDIGKAGE